MTYIAHGCTNELDMVKYNYALLVDNYNSTIVVFRGFHV
ncbi:hypothetical protein EMIT0P100_10971 [Pseudomonas sp. IT-P100]